MRAEDAAFLSGRSFAETKPKRDDTPLLRALAQRR
jgi:hypothetical protein